MELFAISDVVWNGAIAAVVTIVLAYMAERTKRAAVAKVEEAGKNTVKKVEEAGNKTAAKVEEVKTAVVETSGTAAAKVEEVRVVLAGSNASTASALDTIVTTGNAVHTLVNSSMGAQLKLVAELSRWKAVQTGAPEDLRAADLAEKTLREHEGKQATVDAASAAKPPGPS